MVGVDGSIRLKDLIVNLPMSNYGTIYQPRWDPSHTKKSQLPRMKSTSRLLKMYPGNISEGG